MITLLVVAWIVCGLISASLTFRTLRALSLSPELFSPEEIAAWNRKWLVGDLVCSILGFFLGPFGLISPFVSRFS